MGREPRPLLADAVYHVTTRGNNRAPIYFGDDDRRLFLALFRKIVGRLEWLVHEWCLMTNHYHLLVQTPNPDLDRGMHRLNGVYAQTMNDRYGRSGHLFERRYFSEVVEDADYYDYVVDYIRFNPVRAGLCEQPADWPWSGGLSFGAKDADTGLKRLP